MQQQQPQQEFTLAGLTGGDIEAIMNGLNELPGKFGRLTMNKIEGQVIQQVIAAQVPPQKPDDGKKGDDDNGEQKPE